MLSNDRKKEEDGKKKSTILYSLGPMDSNRVWHHSSYVLSIDINDKGTVNMLKANKNKLV